MDDVKPNSPRPRRAAPLLCAIAATLAALPSTAHATPASETVTAGGLSFINGTPSAVAFPSTTLNGTDQVATQTQSLDVSDARGSGAGWNVTATSTLFTNGSATLPPGATSVATAPSVACDASVTCTTATNAITYPYTLPAAATPPTATKLYSAATNTGLGSQTVTPTWRLAIPASALTGSYTATWTLSLVSGP